MNNFCPIWRQSEQQIREIIVNGSDNAFFVLNIDEVLNKVHLWREIFPRVKPFYAVKANFDANILRLMKECGMNFDCASLGEISMVLKIGVDAHRILYANPSKQISHIEFARQHQVNAMTFDSLEELYKIQQLHPKSKLILRIQHDSKSAALKMAQKFGCEPNNEASKLIQACRDLQLNLVGISFHCGLRQGSDTKVHAEGIRVIKNLFEVAKKFNFELRIVNIGGGFCGTDMNFNRKCAKNIEKAIDECFGDSQVEFIAEPGTFFVETSMKLLCCVHSKRKIEPATFHYHLNESVFKSFFESLLGLKNYKFSIYSRKLTTRAKFHSIFFGEALAPFDKINECEIEELSIGDWLIFHGVGNYCTCYGGGFNGFPASEVFVIAGSDGGRKFLRKCEKDRKLEEFESEKVISENFFKMSNL